jgi:hypothetical protein
MTGCQTEEYRALRDTIRERGTARVYVLLVGFVAWAALALAHGMFGGQPLATLVPLGVLAAAFEAIYALHTGVERVGRYLQVRFEEAGDGWESAAMAYGQRFGGGGPDPLFGAMFWLAAALNLLLMPAFIAGLTAAEWAVVGSAHLLFALRVGDARRRAGRQRAVDLERFRELRRAAGGMDGQTPAREK